MDEKRRRDEQDNERRPAPGEERRPKMPTNEIGGPPGPEPTRYGDWERGGRCIDF